MRREPADSTPQFYDPSPASSLEVLEINYARSMSDEVLFVMQGLKLVVSKRKCPPDTGEREVRFWSWPARRLSDAKSSPVEQTRNSKARPPDSTRPLILTIFQFPARKDSLPAAPAFGPAPLLQVQADPAPNSLFPNAAAPERDQDPRKLEPAPPPPPARPSVQYAQDSPRVPTARAPESTPVPRFRVEREMDPAIASHAKSARTVTRGESESESDREFERESEIKREPEKGARVESEVMDGYGYVAGGVDVFNFK
ncbi:hypothetical protein B0H17DRAFT_1197086 [Mycena rosella]|uniref:Uncharacterized protein n=1 Tax=Mycena rosella TaxID=1033263 RepID=A0AAD7DSN6_MYCRO|nr:hypothetical protein B0H17DRAFT_1197086 [Mycena rosella]